MSTSIIPDAPPITDGQLEQLHDFVADSRRLLVLTGAGVSTESGIPDYRSPGGAYSKGYKPMIHQDFVRSLSARRRYWARSFIGWRRFSAARPGTAHRALARLHARGRLEGGIITQNVDRLHHIAGSPALELHGTTHEVVCMNCGDISCRRTFQERIKEANPEWAAAVEHLEEGRPAGQEAKWAAAVEHLEEGKPAGSDESFGFFPLSLAPHSISLLLVQWAAAVDHLEEGKPAGSDESFGFFPLSLAPHSISLLPVQWAAAVEHLEEGGPAGSDESFGFFPLSLAPHSISLLPVQWAAAVEHLEEGGPAGSDESFGFFPLSLAPHSISLLPVRWAAAVEHLEEGGPAGSDESFGFFPLSLAPHSISLLPVQWAAAVEHLEEGGPAGSDESFGMRRRQQRSEETRNAGMSERELMGMRRRPDGDIEITAVEHLEEGGPAGSDESFGFFPLSLAPHSISLLPVQWAAAVEHLEEGGPAGSDESFGFFPLSLAPHSISLLPVQWAAAVEHLEEGGPAGSDESFGFFPLSLAPHSISLLPVQWAAAVEHLEEGGPAGSDESFGFFPLSLAPHSISLLPVQWAAAVEHLEEGGPAGSDESFGMRRRQQRSEETRNAGMSERELMGMRRRPDGDIEISEEEWERHGEFIVPSCGACSGVLKPNVVLFGDNLPPARNQEAARMMSSADSLLVVGSSLMVLSAFRIASQCVQEGKPLALIAVGPNRADGIAAAHLTTHFPNPSYPNPSHSPTPMPQPMRA
ncbi:unnamed protein product [Closterium sp. Naga37s-1]|nr:unnamed protein product [Closterium sp. Naga37s-1]